MTRSAQILKALSMTIPAIGLVSNLGACGSDVAMEDPQGGDVAAASDSTRVHLMKMTTAPADENPINTAGAHLTYYGGPILKNISVIPVYWNSNVQYQSNLNAFYSAIPTSTGYWGLLSQYSSIGKGSRGTPFVDSKGTGKFTDAQVQAELTKQINAGKVPKPNANTYYPIHFPPNVTITAPDGSQSCVVFCAYHGTYKLNGVDVNYGVIPDQGGGCAGGCGTNSQRVNNLTSVSSHEMAEAATDPAVGLATTFAPPLAWYDQTNGEIGDICNGQEATVTGGDGKSYVVQKEWSNSKNACATN